MQYQHADGSLMVGNDYLYEEPGWYYTPAFDIISDALVRITPFPEERKVLISTPVSEGSLFHSMFGFDLC